MLKMDIEGAEYASLLSLNEENLSRFRLIVIEFHDFHYVYQKELHKTIFEPIVMPCIF